MSRLSSKSKAPSTVSAPETPFQQLSREDSNTKIETITPALARHYLAQSAGNRPLRKAHIEMLVREIVEGRWHLTHQGIGFDARGVLVDGHHRLSAIVMADKAVEMRVTRNLDQNVRPAIDTGRTRRFADYLGFAGHTYPVRYGSITRALAILETGVNCGHRVFSPEELWEVFNRHQEAIEAVAERCAQSSIVPMSVYAGMAYAYPAEKAKVIEFAERLKSGAGLEEGSPILALRRRLERHASSGTSRMSYGRLKVLDGILLTLTALRAYVNEQKVTKAVIADGSVPFWDKRRAKVK